jgi:hypothetical protein
MLKVPCKEEKWSEMRVGERVFGEHACFFQWRVAVTTDKPRGVLLVGDHDTSSFRSSFQLPLFYEVIQMIVTLAFLNSTNPVSRCFLGSLVGVCLVPYGSASLPS